MVEKESSRQNRERAFQARVLAAVHAQKQSVLLDILNKPIVLWALSAILISGMSAYLTGYQQCEREGERTTDSFEKVNQEILGRVDAFHRIVADSSTVQEITERLKASTRYVFLEFKDRTLAEIYFEFRRGYARLGLRPPDLWSKPPDASEDMHSKYWWLHEERIPPYANDLIIKEMQEYSAHVLIQKTELILQVKYEPKQDCSFIGVIRSMISGQASVVAIPRIPPPLLPPAILPATTPNEASP
jgi:hypothetical protein